MRIGVFAVAVAVVLLAALAGCTASEPPGGAPAPAVGNGDVTVDVVYLNHPPIRIALTEIDEVLGKYQGDLVVRRLDAEADDGRALAEKNGASEHVAILLIINGEPEADVGGRTVRFEGFPEGTSPLTSAQGTWTLELLDKALAEQVARS